MVMHINVGSGRLPPDIISESLISLFRHSRFVEHIISGPSLKFSIGLLIFKSIYVFLSLPPLPPLPLNEKDLLLSRSFSLRALFVQSI